MENSSPNEVQSNTTITIQIPGGVKISKNRSVVTSTFALAVLCFFLTFCDFRCTTGRKIASINGIELVTGKKMKVETIDFDKDNFDVGNKIRKKTIPPNPYAILAFVAGITGCTVYLVNEKRQNTIGLAAGLAGFIFLSALQYTLTRETDETSHGTIDVKYQLGYWGSITCFGISALISYLRTRQKIEASSVDGFDILIWASANRKKISLVIAGLTLSLGAYFGYFSNNPRRDAKRALASYCDCYKDKMDQLVKDEKRDVDTITFHSAEQAERELRYFYQRVNSNLLECNEKNKYENYKKRYAGDEEMLNTYQDTYDSIMNGLKSEQSERFHIVYNYVRQKWQECMKKENADHVDNVTVNEPAAGENSNEQAWQAILSPEFKWYKEEDDVPGQVERYKDDKGTQLVTVAWGRSIYSDDADSSITEALELVFNDQQKVVKTKDTLFISTGVQEESNGEKQYFYIVYCPKFMQSYALHSKQSDALFNKYSVSLLDAVRTMKAAN